MTTPQATVPMQEPPRAEPPFSPGIVEELLLTLGKAARAHQLYLPNNPVYKGSIDAVRASFVNLWSRSEELALTFTETEVKWLGHVVLEEPGKSADSLPWLFYKDGLREIRLTPGFENEELVRLLDVLQRARKATAEDDDLLTLLWESDFTSLRYKYLDLSLETAPPLLDVSEVQRLTDDEQQQVSAVVEESKASGVVNVADFDSTLYFLDESEIEYLQAELRREYQADLRSNIVGTLLDILEVQPAADVRAEVIEHLETMLVYLLAAGNLRGVAFLIREAGVAAERARELLPEHRDRLGELPARLSSPEVLGQVLQVLDQNPELPPPEDLVALFQELRPTALATVFAWLGRLSQPRLRAILEEAAGRLASTATAELVRLIASPEREVAVEAVRRAGSLKTPAAVAPLARIMTEGDTELRVLGAQALAEIGSAGALQALEKAVADQDREVRIVAVRSLSSRAYRAVLPRLEAAVKGKAIRDADLTEKMAMFEAYGAICGDAGVPYLDGVLNGKGFLGRREDPEVRACAAIALGRVNTPKATEALRQANAEKDVVVRNAVTRALRGVSA